MASRRDFIKKIGAGSAALVATSAFSNIIIPRKQRKLGVALVGLGYYSGVLAPALQHAQHCYLAGIVTGSPWKIPDWQRRYNIPDQNVYNYQNMSEIASNKAIDVVYVVLPTSMHSEYSVLAAEAGKHVWCEKPMAKTVKECQNIIDACRNNKVKLSIGYRMQHEPNTQTIMGYALSKPYGKIKTVTARAGYFEGRSDHWKQQKMMGGGAMYDMGVYPLNAARYATAEEPISIYAWHETSRPDIYHEVDETTYFELEFPSGAKASCATSLGKGMNDLEIKCAYGSYGLSPFQSYGGIRGETGDGILLNKRIPNQQARQMDDDALAILRNESVLVPGEEGLRDIRIVEAAYQSAQEKRTISL
ncbi:MAG: Gfo/Idh/MocA family oxidoreductase [Cyclobacteriaceae bacterium]|nr:Gfo/Idh/MocA family oxidoreductase [Cyclobacteriaceae bacterium HetDA_MAG_MS6]